MTPKEKDDFIKQLKSDLKKWRDAYTASQKMVEAVTKDNVAKQLQIQQLKINIDILEMSLEDKKNRLKQLAKGK